MARNRSSTTLLEYANESYEKFKLSKDFDLIMCSLIHAEKHSTVKSLTNEVRVCRYNPVGSKINMKRIESVTDELGHEALLTYGIEKTQTITQHYTKLARIVLNIYKKDESIENRHPI